MKFGFRTPSLKKSISARTTGRAKRAIKRAIIPGYGQKGMGFLHDPKKAVYNAIYRRTTFGLSDLFKVSTRKSRRSTQAGQVPVGQEEGGASLGCFIAILIFFAAVLALLIYYIYG